MVIKCGRADELHAGCMCCFDSGAGTNSRGEHAPSLMLSPRAGTTICTLYKAEVCSWWDTVPSRPAGQALRNAFANIRLLMISDSCGWMQLQVYATGSASAFRRFEKPVAVVARAQHGPHFFKHQMTVPHRV